MANKTECVNCGGAGEVSYSFPCQDCHSGEGELWALRRLADSIEDLVRVGLKSDKVERALARVRKEQKP